RPEYIPAYLSNGLVGIRVGRIPFREGLAIVGGLAALHHVEEVEGFARAPYPLGGDVVVDGVDLSGHAELARVDEQRYDCSCCELVTRFRFTAPGATVRLET